MSGLSVNSVNNNFSISSSSSQKLTEETKSKLQALGLDPSKYTTEAQGRQALKEAQAAQNSQAAQAGAQPQHAAHGGESSIKAEVQALAAQVGVPVGSKDKISDILANISKKITELKASAGNDPTKLSQVNDYQSKYNAISGEIAQKQTSESKLTGSLQGLANYNKIALGLS